MIYDVLIVGGGPAGLTAAIYAKRAGKSVIVFEGLGVGGQIAKANIVENYPGIKAISGFDLSMSLYEQAESLGAVVQFEQVTDFKDGKIKEITTDFGTYQGKSLIIATGVKNRPLGNEKENRFIGNGISYCAVCDGAFFKNQTVAVVGGGNSAVDDAYYLAEFCKKVYLIHRRDEFRCEEAVLNKTKSKENVEIITNSTVKYLLGEKELNGIIIENKQGEERTLDDVKGLFVAIGKVPSNDLFKDYVALDDSGYVDSGEDCLTKSKGVFVAGDCRKKEIRQLSTATSDGATAALKAVEYLKYLD